MQNRKLKPIDCLWDFDYHGAEFDIRDFRTYLRDGPWPLPVVRETDKYTRDFGTRVRSSGSNAAVGRWCKKVREVLKIYLQGRAAYSFEELGPHQWILEYGKNLIHGDRPLLGTMEVLPWYKTPCSIEPFLLSS